MPEQPYDDGLNRTVTVDGTEYIIPRDRHPPVLIPGPRGEPGPQGQPGPQGLPGEASGAIAIDEHNEETTDVHGIADTAELVISSDPRLDNARTPLAHTQTAATITDFVEAAQDAIAALLGAGSNITLFYDDEADDLTITAAAGDTFDPEAVRDAIGIALVGAGLVSVGVNDGADTITISTTATANSTDAFLLDRANHTGSQTIATVTGLQAALDGLVPGTRTVGAGSGLTGGGALSADLTLAADFGTVAGKVTEGNDARIGNALKILGKNLPATPGTSEDQHGFVYDNASGAWIYAKRTRQDTTFRSGRYYATADVAGVSAGAPVVNRYYAVPFFAGDGNDFDRVAFEITTLIGGGNIRLSIMSDSAGYPGAIIDQVTGLSTNTLGVTEWTIARTLTGWVWIGFVEQVSNGVQVRCYSPLSRVYAGPVGKPSAANSNQQVAIQMTGVSGALPDPFPAGVASTTFAPIIYLRKV